MSIIVVSLVMLMSLEVAHGLAFVNWNTTTGPVTGFLDGSIKVFWGIPFAKPPVGPGRFKPPEKVANWSIPVNATQRPNACWQNIDSSFNRSPKVEMWNPNTKMSEDCLYLNVWLPNTTGVKPILVWIYGGGFFSGSSALDVYDGSVLAKKNNVIVVSFNYRVGALGFLYTGDAECPGNVGLLDQVMALQWIKENVLNMGGDPNTITLFGESAGAVSVGFHLMSNLSRNLFNNAIMMSGSPIVDWGIKTREDALNRTQSLASDLGCSSKNLTTLVNCLRDITSERLTQGILKLFRTYFDPPLAAVVDGYFLLQHPKDLLRDGQVKKTKLIMGVVKNEGSYWLTYGLPDIFNVSSIYIGPTNYLSTVSQVLAPFGENYTKTIVRDIVANEYYDTLPPWEKPTSYLESLENLSSDTLFKCSVVTFAQLYTLYVGGEVYMYSYEHRESILDWPEWFGVPHGYELGFFFGVPFKNSSIYRASELSLSEEVMKRVANFARTSNPNYPEVKVVWPQYSFPNVSYLEITENSTSVKVGLRQRSCDFWTKQVPILTPLDVNTGTIAPPGNTDTKGCVRSNASYTAARLAPCLLVLLFLSVCV
ncbi:cholinesterase 1-like [Biomphalaria glabrata]|uniref:Cholinesterase 1-like n=1 Tax=Biomphalaria glabrata TaxID=6526 RepID=A0A9W3AYQ0_BIOGL|nr:cholinesterase 1-like [Biomphalaria glabrata]XP_055892359.1 cholinesterase 1-like [Biomphalaria glabrata]XP_055892360.1 cholinesterase 1-like [Biomphalaria glabrata]XP_055892361.1 cholinesterase 1-like [Biomphalaria glabrata]